VAYMQPPSMVSNQLATSGTANTLTANRAVLGAPGANTCYRVVAIHVAGFRSNTGKINLLFHDGAGGTPFFRAGIPVGGNDAMPIPEPGIQLPANSAMQVDDISDVATQSYYWTIYYYVDQLA